MTDDKPSKSEFMKEKSRFLRGTIADGLTHVETGAISEDDFQLSEVSRLIYAGRPRRARRALQEEARQGLHVHDPVADSRRLA